MLSKGWIFVIMQFACIIYLLLELTIFQGVLAVFFQLVAIFLGLWAVYESRKGRLGILPEVLSNSRLLQTGPYRKIRHPMYSSLILFFLAALLYSPSLTATLVFILLTINLILKLSYEEKLLLKEFPEYKQYQEKTVRLIPFIY